MKVIAQILVVISALALVIGVIFAPLDKVLIAGPRGYVELSIGCAILAIAIGKVFGGGSEGES